MEKPANTTENKTACGGGVDNSNDSKVPQQDSGGSRNDDSSDDDDDDYDNSSSNDDSRNDDDSSNNSNNNGKDDNYKQAKANSDDEEEDDEDDITTSAKSGADEGREDSEKNNDENGDENDNVAINGLGQEKEDDGHITKKPRKKREQWFPDVQRGEYNEVCDDLKFFSLTLGKCDFNSEDEVEKALWELAAKEWNACSVNKNLRFLKKDKYTLPRKDGLRSIARQCTYFDATPCK